MTEYIRKQDAVNSVEYANGNITWAERDDCKKRLEELSPADVAPVVHAYWRDTGSGQECSDCKEIQYGYDTGRHYCANCGAKMDGKKRK